MRYLPIATAVLSACAALTVLSEPTQAAAQTITISSMTASPASVKPGQTVTFTATMTASQNLSNYPVLFSLLAPGASAGNNTTQQLYWDTFKAGAALVQTDSWTVPAGAKTGTYTLYVGVYNPAWSVELAQTAVTLTVAVAAPTDLEPPVVSGAAQVGKVLSSTTGTWTGAPYSVAYQWAGNNAKIAGATAATYTPVSSDAGHTLTSTVTATGSSGAAASATSAPTVPIVAASSGTSVPFVALHTYYISPTGSDSNNGTSPSTPWATPKHAVVCGDVIIAAAGSYASSQFGVNQWGVVSSCPSTAGGIDGTGGVYFATVLCAGPNMSSCPVNGGGAEAFRIDRSNWAAEGFTATQNTNGQGACYSVTSDFASTNVDYTAFVNDIASTCDLAGFDSYGWSRSNGVTDMTAVVGVISYNGSPGTSECGSGISMIPGSTSVTGSGTHVFVAGAFVYHSIDGSSCAGTNKTTDGEGIIFDSWTCGSVAYTYQGVAEQNVLWGNGSAGFEIFPNCNHAWDKSPYVIFNNTSYGNYQDQYHTGNDGELALQNITPVSGLGSYTATNNIFEATTLRTGSTNDTMVALEVWCQTVCTTEVNVSGNYGWKSNPGTVTVAGTPNTDVWNTSHNTTSFPFGTNTYSTPGFANPGGLPTSAPNCSGYTNTTSCMNSGYSVYADLTPSGAAAGVGYKPPGACATDAYYPTWLKGIVYLQWSGTALSENAGLINKPCNL